MVSAPSLREALVNGLADGGIFVVDMTGVTFLGSAGLAVLVEAARMAPQHSANLKVVAKGRAGKPRTSRSLATGTVRAPAAGWVEVPLRVVKRYRAELRERGRLKARARLDFVPAVGEDRIQDSVDVVFKQRDGKKKH